LSSCSYSIGITAGPEKSKNWKVLNCYSYRNWQSLYLNLWDFLNLSIWLQALIDKVFLNKVSGQNNGKKWAIKCMESIQTKISADTLIVNQSSILSKEKQIHLWLWTKIMKVVEKFSKLSTRKPLQRKKRNFMRFCSVWKNNLNLHLSSSNLGDNYGLIYISGPYKACKNKKWTIIKRLIDCMRLTVSMMLKTGIESSVTYFFQLLVDLLENNRI